MAHPRLSVIVPVKNGAKYLAEMVDSILAQTMSDYELLIVDNGSTDCTNDIIDAYLKKDSRIQKISCGQPGVSFARNAGIQKAAGTYMMFLDADDWISEDYFREMTDAIQGYDMVTAGYRAYFEKGTEDALYYDCFYESPTEEQGSLTAEQMLARLFQTKHYQGYVWNKIFQTGIIMDNHLCFDTDICYNEDRLFVVRYLLCCSGMVRKIGVNRYHYRLHAGNAVSAENVEFPQEKEFTEIEAFYRAMELLEGHDAPLRCLKENLVERELLLFARMQDRNGLFRYRKSVMRKYARIFRKLGYTPKNKEEEKLIAAFIRYGFTGECYK